MICFHVQLITIAYSLLKINQFMKFMIKFKNANLN